MAQIFPPPDECIRMLNTSISWFVWKGAIFRVPLSTLQRRKDEGGWDLIQLKAKCLALLLHHTWQQSQNPETFTAAWLNRWCTTDKRNNPPHRGGIPVALDYLRRILIEYAYATSHDRTETQRTNKRRLYNTIHTMMRRETGNQDIRIVRQRPDIQWKAVWRNLHNAPVPEKYNSEWYKAIHDILSTQDRLHKIRLVPTNKCRNCQEPDTMAHRIITCGNAREVWHWTKKKVAQILTTTPDHIPTSGPHAHNTYYDHNNRTVPCLGC